MTTVPHLPAHAVVAIPEVVVKYLRREMEAGLLDHGERKQIARKTLRAISTIACIALAACRKDQMALDEARRAAKAARKAARRAS